MANMSPYENEKLRKMPEYLLRPGGFALTERLVSLAELAPGVRVLDIGCAAGSAAAFLADRGFDAVGIDGSRVLIERGMELFPELCLIESNAEKLPFDGASFDAVLFECSLSLMDAELVLPEAWRILRVGGKLLISDVFSGVSGSFSAGLSLRNEEEFGELLRQNGFVISHFEDKTIVLEEFVAQLIMCTGSLDALFDCAQWADIKKAKPRYCIAIAQKMDY